MNYHHVRRRKHPHLFADLPYSNYGVGWGAAHSVNKNRTNENTKYNEIPEDENRAMWEQRVGPSADCRWKP